MRIIATLVRGEELQPGDLFSTLGPEYWDKFPQKAGVGERVYIRTLMPCPVDQRNEQIYRVTVVNEEV